jgi:hypothetical protein
MKWTQVAPPSNFTLPVPVVVRSVNDPYVRAYNEDLLNLTQSSTKLSILGLILMFGALCLGMLPGAFCLTKCRRKKQLLMEMEVEMRGNRI